MTAAGVALAGCVATFAILAVRNNDGVPMVHGVEHLAVFARPSRALDERLAAIGAEVNRDARPAPDGDGPAIVDFAPTATIQSSPRRSPVFKTFKDYVLVEDRMGPVILRPGAYLQGVGRLEDIRDVRGQWVATFGPDRGADQSSR